MAARETLAAKERLTQGQPWSQEMEASLAVIAVEYAVVVTEGVADALVIGFPRSMQEEERHHHQNLPN